MRIKYFIRKWIGVPGFLAIDGLLRLVGLLRRGREYSGVKKGAKIIAFQSYSVHLAQFLKTIINSLSEDPNRYHVVFILLAHPHFSRQSRRELKNYARDHLSLDPSQIVDSWKVGWRHADLFITNDQYAQFPASRGKTVLLMHGPGITRRVVESKPGRKTISDFDCTLLNGEFDRRLLSSEFPGATMPGRVDVVGFSYLDGLITEKTTRADYLSMLGLDPVRKTVLIAPAWIGYTVMTQDGKTILNDIITAVSATDMNIILKLHACSFNLVMAKGIDWQMKLKQYSGIPRFRIDYDPDDIPAIRHADMLITDVSSRALNFMLLEKPVILYASPFETGDTWASRRMTLIRDGAIEATDPTSLQEAISVASTNQTPRSGARESAAEAFSYFGEATGRLQDWIDVELSEAG